MTSITASLEHRRRRSPADPGAGGRGVVIVSQREDGWDPVVGAIALRECSHHEAEYEAAIQALRVAADMGADEALVRCDPLVLVHQMNDLARVRAPKLIRVAERVRAKMDRFDRIEIVWVHRRKDEAADLLSKVGLSKADLALEAAAS